jgi:integrase
MIPDNEAAQAARPLEGEILSPLKRKSGAALPSMKGKRGTTKFTDRFLRSLPPPLGKDYFKFDSVTPGLGVRVTRSSKTFVFKRGSALRIPIGRYPDIDIAGARKEARALRHRLDHGEDLGADRRARRGRKGAVARGEILTLKGAVEAWIRENPNRASQAHLNRARRDIGRAFGMILKRPFDELTFEDFQACLRVIKGEMAAHGAGVRAGVVCRWTAAEYGIANPLAGKAKKLPPARDPRQVYLTGAQMRKIYAAAAALGSPGCELIRFLMLTVVRRNEAACARWSELDDDFAAWEVPGPRMKGGRRARMHWVPLGLPVRTLLKRHEDRGRLGDFIFTYTGETAARGFSDFKVRLDKSLADAGLPPWRVHDFRRSFTMWAMKQGKRFGFAVSDVANRALAHQTGDKIKRTYNPYEYMEERRTLLAAWADYLTEEGEQKPAEPPELAELPPPSKLRALPGPAPRSTAPSFATIANIAASIDPPRSLVGDLAFMISSHEAVVKANAEIWKRPESRYTKNFLDAAREAKEKDPARGAIQALLYTGVQLACDIVTGLKRREMATERAKLIEQHHEFLEIAGKEAEIAKGRRNEAAATRRFMPNQEDFARKAETEAAEAETKAARARREAEAFASRAARIPQFPPRDLKLPRTKMDRHREAQKAFYELLKLIFIRPAPQIATAYMEATFNTVGDRFWLRERRKAWKAGSTPEPVAVPKAPALAET